MPTLRTYRVFISHAWHRSEHYRTVARWLDDAKNLSWENLSVPEHDPVDDAQLEYELRNQMRPADVFLILGGMYAAHSRWIDFELKFSRQIGRPIVGVRPWGQERMPSAIQHVARDVVGWNASSVVRAIRVHALPTG